MTTKIFFSIVFLLTVTIAKSQTVEGYKYEKYPVKTVFTGKKAAVNYNSSPTAKSFRTQIKNQYKEGKIDFAGYYVTITWGCGTGCTMGAMVDVRDGKVYDLPDCEINSDNYCEGKVYKRGKTTSRMYVTSSCGFGDSRQEKPTYVVFLWDEGKKKFLQLTKTDGQTCEELFKELNSN